MFPLYKQFRRLVTLLYFGDRDQDRLGRLSYRTKSGDRGELETEWYSVRDLVDKYKLA